MATQRFCLRWNNHQSNMLSVFDQLLHAETFTDVTLAVDGQLLKAHKMVLSACSPYFQALFVNHQEKHPIVILKDVPYADMKSLLDFMYRGEVSVDQERLTAFLKVAESLRIKGLTEVNEEKCDIPALTNSLIQQQSHATPHTPPPQLHRIHPYMHQKRPASGMPTGGAPPNLLMPLLGNALMQPKRKRGRPRKLSGSSSDALNTAASPPGEFVPETASHASTNRPGVGDQLVRGSPEMLEVKMSMDGFNAEDGGTSGGEEAGEALLIDEGDDAQSGEAPTGKDSESAEYHYFDEESDGMPIITLEVMPDSLAETIPYDSYYPDPQQNSTSDEDMKDVNSMAFDMDKSEAGMHFLVDKTEPEETNESIDEAGTNFAVRADLLEYVTRSDGSVSCKMCGKVLASRTHWYRHKYRAHSIHPVNPAPLFQCEQCLVYFKSRKGYIGHITSKHSETLQDASPVLTNAQAEALAKEKSKIQTRQIKPEPDKQETVETQTEEIMETEVKKEPDPEMAIPKTVVPTFQNVTVKQTTTRSTEMPRKSTRSTRQSIPRTMDILEQANEENEKEWNERRSREEKLVADIIARVRRECEAQGTGGSTRRGYSRKSGLHT